MEQLMNQPTLQDVAKYRSLLSSGRCLEVMQWLANVAIHGNYLLASGILDALKESILKRDSDDMFSILNRELSGMESTIIGWENTDKIIDYTTMNPGDFDILGNLVSICPECGRPGVVSQEPGYFHTTDHAISLFGLGHEILDRCHLNTGLPWRDDDQIRWTKPGWTR